MTSAIDPTKPTTYVAFTNDVRNNFQFAHDEITALQNATATTAPLNSPIFTGDPQAPTPATTDNDQSIATTAFVKAQGYLTGNQTITISGDNTGSGTTAIATTTTGLQGRPLAATAPSLNQVLQWNGSTWLPATVAAGGGASVTTSDTAPASPHPGDLWWDSVGGQLYVYYQDPNTSQWVPATNQAGLSLPVSVANGGTGATTAPAALTNLGAAPTASPTFTGTVTIPPGASISGYAPLASPAFTGTPSLPTGTTGVTQTAGNSSTALATTAFVGTALGGYLPLTGGQINPGGVLVGAAGTVPAAGALTLNANTVAPNMAGVTGSSLYILQANTTSTQVVLDAVGGGAAPYLTGRGARGTAAAPTAVLSGDSVLVIRGIGATAANTYSSGSTPAILLSATENWTTTANGSCIYLQTSANGTTALSNSLILAGNSATFSGDVSVPGGVYIAGPVSAATGRITADSSLMAFHMGSGNGGFFFQNNAGTNAAIMDASGNFTISGSTGTKASGTTWANPSSRDIKNDIKDYDKGLQAILSLRPRTYKFNKDSGFSTCETHIGLVHDETGHMPEMHTKATLGGTPDKLGREVDALDCSAITFALCNAVKELKAEIDDLKAKLDSR